MSLLFRRTATVYGRAAVGGRFTVVLTSGLACNLLHIASDGAPSGAARSEMAATRRFVWEPSYTMPAFCQIEVDGLRWNPVNTNAIETMRGPDGQPHHSRCDVVRAAA